MDTPAMPPEGLAWRPPHSGNAVLWDGTAVVKRYQARPVAFFRERAVLRKLQALPVPRPLPAERALELRYRYLDGSPGTALLERGLASRLLHDLGAFLRRLHSLEPHAFAGVVPGSGPVLVHGDFAHYNALGAADGSLVAVLDWETARLGSPALDLAWCEWQLATRFPGLRFAVNSLLEGYGDPPPAAEREQALRERLAELHQSATLSQLNRAAPQLYHRCAFAGRDEAAAFAAALTRFASGPRGDNWRAPEAGFLLLADPDAGEALYLSDAALRATQEGFGQPQVGQTLKAAELPASCELIYDGACGRAWGSVEAARQLWTEGLAAAAQE